jgi:hypothetical protein
VPALADRQGGSGGLLIAVLGHISPEEAQRLASARHSAGAAMALLLAVSTWTAQQPGEPVPGGTSAAASVLAAAGWRVATVTADLPLTAAWEMLKHPAGQPASPAPAGTAQ